MITFYKRAAVAGGVPKEKAGILEQKKLKRDNSFWPIKHLVPGPFSFPHVLLCALISSCTHLVKISYSPKAIIHPVFDEPIINWEGERVGIVLSPSLQG